MNEKKSRLFMISEMQSLGFAISWQICCTLQILGDSMVIYYIAQKLIHNAYSHLQNNNFINLKSLESQGSDRYSYIKSRMCGLAFMSL